MIWVGTSGFQYPEWKGKFYPEKFSPKKMLAFYSERFNSTESNYTFRRMPSESTLTNWAAQTPERFRFSLKAPQEITHFRKLRGCEPVVRQFTNVSQALGPKLGAILFQLPPSFPCDVALLREFLDMLPRGFKAAFEFRHESWFNDDVFAALRAKNCALCIADSEKLHAPVILTAQHAYFRLRDEGYGTADIRRWAKEVEKASASVEDTYVYFKHEEKGLGPEFARQLVKHLDCAAT
ncbi:MAG TPA: DUF72 domain-containing protein [Verrucomicrobiae bacterium]